MSQANLSPTVNSDWKQFNRKQLTLLIIGILTLLIYAAILWLSFDCEQKDPKPSRPLLWVISLFSVAGVGYLVACWSIVWRGGWAKLRPRQAMATNSTFLWIVLGFGIAFRLVLLFSIPIQEVDLFRYIWDGTVLSQGISPYEYSPQEIEFYPDPEKGVPNYRTTQEEREDIANLSKIATSPGMERAFGLVHYEEYTTPYPLVNQPAFALAAVIGRAIDNFWGLLYAMKGVLTLFDIATALLLIGLLKRLALPGEWVVAYFWCPLLLKEIANSGHLDSIAVFLSVAAVYLMVRTYWKAASDDGQQVNQSNLPSDPNLAADLAAEINDVDNSAAVDLAAKSDSSTSMFFYSILIACVLAAAVAAKIFPAVLGPIWAIVMLKRIRFAAILPLAIFAVATLMLLWPMIGKTNFVKNKLDNSAHQFIVRTGVRAGLEPLYPANQYPLWRITAPGAGIEAFAKYWEMNDFIFMVAIENLKPYGNSPEEFVNSDGAKGSKVWFVKTTNQFRHSISQWYADFAGVRKFESPFSMTRRATLLVFCLIVSWGCYRVARYDDPMMFLEMTFLMVAWFWFLAPTQNPWYWTWALPWLVFCRNRIWFMVAVITMAYYLRFYFEYHGVPESGSTGLMGTPYAGTAFFDYIFPVLEFAPILILLAITWILRSIFKSGSQTQTV